MNDRQFKIVRISLAALMALCLGLGLANWRQQRAFELPTDGVQWSESAVGLVARVVVPGGAAASAGLQPGDILFAIGRAPAQVHTLKALAQFQFEMGAGSRAIYTVIREGQPLSLALALESQVPSLTVRTFLWLAGLFYLFLGAWALWQRARAKRARLFALYCTSSFALFVFSYTGKFDALDWTIYGLDAAAMLLQPALFAHFCLTYWEPARRAGSSHSPAAARIGARNLRYSIYGTAVLLGLIHAGFSLGFLDSVAAPLSDSRWWVDRMETGYLVAMYVLGMVLLARTLRLVQSRLLWKQVAWVFGAALTGLGPFVAIYGIPYFLGNVPQPWMALSVISLIALPAGMAYAMARHRLLDIEVALGRGVAYTLATSLLVGAYLGLAALAGDLFRRAFPEVGTLGLIATVVATGILFQPLQRWIQRGLDQHFLRQRYDYRKTVLQLGQQLSRHSSREEMVRSLLGPLTELFDLDRAALFLPAGNGEYQLYLECENGPSAALAETQQAGGDLGYLRLLEDSQACASARHRDWLHFPGWDEEVTEELGAESWEHAGWRQTLREMKLPYYFPCRAQNRLVAVLGLGRTTGGELLTEQDAALAETLAGYLALALESGTLLESLTQKAREFADLQQFSENILESINVGLLAVDLEDRVEAVNTPLELMVSLPFRQAKGRHLQELLPADLLVEFERSREDMGIHNIARYRIAGSSGPERVLHIAIAPLLSRNCECIGRLLVFDDITDRVALETQLAQAEKLSSIGLLAAGVAHEVNTPLTVISTQAQMLAKQLQSPAPAPVSSEKSAKIIERIISQTFRASEIVNSLLNFSRTKSSEFAPVEMNQLIAETLVLLEHPLKTAQIQVETHLEPGLALISGNSGKLQQVLLNLILNARDAMPQGGRLRLTTWTEDSTVRVEVGDTGVGIAPENLSRIYDPFFTTKSPGKLPGKDPGAGTGLGLAVSYGIIHEHGGLLRAESKPGAGSRFEMQFPALRKTVHA